MNWTVELLRTALRQIEAFPPAVQDRIFEALQRLKADPRPPGCKKLRGRPAWRVRVGDYRIIYEIYDERLLVLVVEVGHRKEIYR